MQNCEFVTLISALACSIAKDKTSQEISILASIFTQLRRYTSNSCSIGRKSSKMLIYIFISNDIFKYFPINT